MSHLLQYRFVLVIALLAVAAALLTDRGRIPLALRGLRRVLGGGSSVSGKSSRRAGVSRGRRGLAFLLVLAAFLLAVAG